MQKKRSSKGVVEVDETYIGSKEKDKRQKSDRYIAKYEKSSHCVNPRDLHMDKPSRTVTCRNLGGATADMLRIRLKNGKRRMLR